MTGTTGRTLWRQARATGNLTIADLRAFLDEWDRELGRATERGEQGEDVTPTFTWRDGSVGAYRIEADLP